MRSRLIWQMLYLMGATNSSLSLSWLAPLQHLTQIAAKQILYQASAVARHGGEYDDVVFLCLSSAQSVHSVLWQPQFTEMNIDKIKSLWPKPLPWNPRPSTLHYQTLPGIQADNLYLSWNQCQYISGPEHRAQIPSRGKKKKRTEKKPKAREPGRQIAQFRPNGCAHGIQERGRKKKGKLN